jgi:hypothetical protein
MNSDEDLVANVSGASAFCLLSVLPSIAALPPEEAFERLKEHFLTAFLAYFDGQEDWGFSEPQRD